MQIGRLRLLALTDKVSQVVRMAWTMTRFYSQHRVLILVCGQYIIPIHKDVAEMVLSPLTQLITQIYYKESVLMEVTLYLPMKLRYVQEARLF